MLLNITPTGMQTVRAALLKHSKDLNYLFIGILVFTVLTISLGITLSSPPKTTGANYEINVAMITTPTGSTGTGFVIMDDAGEASRYMLTARHVVADCQIGEDVTLYFHWASGETTTGRVVWMTHVAFDKTNMESLLYDVAIIEMEEIPEEVTGLPIGDSENIQNGQKGITLIGYPIGKPDVSVEGSIRSENEMDKTTGKEYSQLFRFSNEIDSGYSGGPILDEHGNVIGITIATGGGSDIFRIGLKTHWAIYLMEQAGVSIF